MKVYDRDGKINFVDENNVFLGYDMNQKCCEYAGWFISTKQEDKRRDNDINPSVLEGFNFDTKFFKNIVDTTKEEYHGTSTSIVIFRAVKGNEEYFIHLYNTHNGYYAHGFKMLEDGLSLYQGDL